MNVNAGHERTSKARIIHQIQLIRGITKARIIHQIQLIRGITSLVIMPMLNGVSSASSSRQVSSVRGPKV
ncbi:Transposase [Shigella dysenteriae 1617]|uniref:Transposase n=1 Tax=Shigella dysenteriae 1617 TaxID=754093 RepID=A0A0A6ZMM5_SHIDY|nr:Transposase [Shigella dysenteriae 1617]AHA63311.1 Transposase [Shigella dysenteriae 1617]AHA67525.1 Transposase [Shigella dysenteriae 1617]AHA68755.1 Transposase [Shigella dysenteriae 1617]